MGGQEQVKKEKQSQVKDFVLLPNQSLKWTVLVPSEDTRDSCSCGMGMHTNIWLIKTNFCKLST